MNIENKLNILFISKYAPHKHTGPYYSARNQAYYMSKINNVMWYNLNSSTDKYWEETEVYYNTSNFKDKTIKDLPNPFNKPDIIIFQGIYEYKIGSIIKEAIKLKIPYIIIPRSSLTQEAQNQKRIKKLIANKLIYKRLIKNASAIQYLTDQEKNDSGMKWNSNSFVIPNGIESRLSNVRKYDLNKIKGLFIGRLDMNHKGLDLLIKSLKNVKEKYIKNDHEIHLYGPESSNNPKEKIEELIKKYSLEQIVKIKEPIYGEEKINKLKEYDYFIMTSRFEGHPMGLIEALSFGMPVFITRGTNMYDVVKGYDAGWVCENNVQSITEELKVMLGDLNNLEIKSNNAYKLSKLYTWEDLTIETDRIIRKLKRESK